MTHHQSQSLTNYPGRTPPQPPGQVLQGSLRFHRRDEPVPSPFIKLLYYKS